MKKILLFIVLVSLATTGFSQTTDEVQIINVIDQLFEGMRETDSVKVRAVIHKGATLKTVVVKRDNEPLLRVESIERFIQSVGTKHEGIYDEKIWSYDIRVDGNLATAWTTYTFYLNENMLHCGVNAFELFKSADGWKISGITDTRRRNDCIAEPRYVIDKMLNDWHYAAATADEDVFFGSMTEDCIYIGTDKSERWLRDELKAWSATYFDRETAWAFEPIERQIFLSDDGKTAWFNETLNTWMGVCRSSGVVALVGNEWKLKQYHLSMTVPNDVVNDFIKLVEKYEAETKK